MEGIGACPAAIPKVLPQKLLSCNCLPFTGTQPRRGVTQEQFVAMLDWWMRRYSTERLKAIREDGKPVHDTVDGRRRRLGLPSWGRSKKNVRIPGLQLFAVSAESQMGQQRSPLA